MAGTFLPCAISLTHSRETLCWDLFWKVVARLDRKNNRFLRLFRGDLSPRRIEPGEDGFVEIGEAGKLDVFISGLLKAQLEKYSRSPIRTVPWAGKGKRLEKNENLGDL